MTLPVLLDTHVFLWLMMGSSELRNLSALEDAAASRDLWVSAITCWEIGMLVSRGRVTLDMPCRDWIKRALLAPGISYLELTPNAAVEASFLPGSFHGDPADRMLVASARMGSLRLATRDGKILNYGEQGFVHVLAC